MESKVDEYVYIRVSTSKQANDGNGLDAQEEGINRYLNFKGVTVPRENWFIDKGRSAASLDRPDFNKLMKIVTAKTRGSIVYAYKRDRVIRDVIDLYTLQNVFKKKHNVIFETVKDGPIGWETALEEFVEVLKTASDKLEIIKDSERTKDCIYAAALKGNFSVGYTPLGYRKRKVGKKASALIIDKKNSELIRYGFQYIIDNNCTKYTAAEHFNEIELLGVKWIPNRVISVFTNPIYYGTFKTPSFKIENHSPAIIDKELFDQACKCLDRKIRYTKKQYIYKDKMYCKDCGCYMHHESVIKRRKRHNKLYLYYFCHNCKRRINQDALSRIIDSKITEVINKKDSVDPLRLLDEEIQKNKDNIADALDLKIKGCIPQKKYDKIRKEMERDILILNKKRSLFLQESDIMQFEKLTFISKRDVLIKCVNRIEYSFKREKFKIIPNKG